MTLDVLNTGISARITKVGGEGALRRHLLDMGAIPGAEVTVVKKAPMGDPVEISLHGYALSLRLNEASLIEVEALQQKEEPPSKNDDFSYNLSLHEHNSHPGLGETGKYHIHDTVEPLPKGTPLSFMIIGQQNCGKTALFNRLTGSNQHVGNYPGVTSERKDGTLKGRPDITVTDLPGICSLSAQTSEEELTRQSLIQGRPDVIINVVDAGNIERNLYLTVQLMELDIPMVLSLNMMDEVRGSGGAVRLNEMERLLGIPVVSVAASRGEGIEELVEHAEHIARYRERPARHDFCDKNEDGGAVHRCLHGIMHLVEDHAAAAGLPVRFVADRLVEGDELILSALLLTKEEKTILENIIGEMETELGEDRHVAMARMRFSFVDRLCRRTVVKPTRSHGRVITDRIDAVLTGRWTAIPAFIAVIASVFFLTFDVIGANLQNLLHSAISSLGAEVDRLFAAWSVTPTVRSLVSDGVFGGVGLVVSFVPVIVVLFFFLSILEDSGYMARIAFLSDKLLSRLGLSGRSIVPMLIGFGCTVPGVMACRTLPSARDRRLTVLLTPFMSCSAKIAVYSFLVSAFFPAKGGLIMTGLYFLGILISVLLALGAKLLGKGMGASPFVMELPLYRVPSPKNVAHLLWDRTKDFISNAFTVIFVATLIVWFLQSFDFKLNFVSGPDSILASVAGWMSPLFAPLGLGDWRLVTSLVSGLMAKESIVSTMQVLGAAEALTGAGAASLLVFTLLYSPCVASIAAIRRELGRCWALWVVVFQCVLAWVCAFLTYLILG